MAIKLQLASAVDAEKIAALVMALTEEICIKTETAHFDIDLQSTTERCRSLLEQQLYQAILVYDENVPVGVATISISYALYAAGKIGVVQEFYIAPQYRSQGVGKLLMDQVKQLAEQQQWSSIELCTPPLPEFERSLEFYQRHQLIPVGGRKMRLQLSAAN